MGRVADRPLSVGVQEVVPEDVQVVLGVCYPPSYGDEVLCVVGWDVPRARPVWRWSGVPLAY